MVTIEGMSSVFDEFTEAEIMLYEAQVRYNNAASAVKVYRDREKFAEILHQGVSRECLKAAVVKARNNRSSIYVRAIDNVRSDILCVSNLAGDYENIVLEIQEFGKTDNVRTICNLNGEYLEIANKISQFVGAPPASRKNKRTKVGNQEIQDYEHSDEWFEFNDWIRLIIEAAVAVTDFIRL